MSTTSKKNLSEDYFGEYIPQLIGEKIAEYIEAPKTLSLVIAATYIITIGIACYFLYTELKSHDERIGQLITADVYNTMHGEFSKLIMISRTMSNDTFLKQNLQNEQNISPDEEIGVMKDFLGDLKNNFGYNITFVVSAATQNYYYDGGFNKVVDAENNPYDVWYKNFLEKNIPYGVEIDYNEFDRNLWDVFVNARIEDSNGNLLGVCGIGMAMQDLQKILADKETQYSINIDLLRQNENLSEVQFKESRLNEILLEMQERFDFQTVEFIFDEVGDISIAAFYLPEISSYVIVSHDNTAIKESFSDLIFDVASYSGVVLFVLIIFVQFNIGKENKKLREETQRQGIVSNADKYALMFLIELKYNTLKTLSRAKDFNLLQIRDGGNASRKIKNSLISTTQYETVRGLLKFINFEDLQQRIQNKRAISYEFLSKDYGWCRANFILLDDYGGGEINQVVFAIENIEAERRHEEDLKRRSETDAMTGLKNRGGGEKAIRYLIDTGTPGMFCLMDADKFKSINDNYGHDVGDKVIKAIADCLKRTFRRQDVTMRLGGDEYAVYAVNINDEENGRKIINRLFEEIDAINIPELGDRKITISLGSAFFKAGEHLTFEEIYHRADLGTYSSKKIQGNCQTFYDPEIHKD